MSRDDEAEAIAMQMAMQYETSVGWNPTMFLQTTKDLTFGVSARRDKTIH